MNLGWVGQTLVLPCAEGLPFAVRGGCQTPVAKERR